MRIDRYLVLDDRNSALSLIVEIDALLGEHWTDPVIHPESGEALVAWNDAYLSKAHKLQKGKRSVSLQEAILGGWIFGIHQGRFGKARLKLEEAMAIRNALDQFDNYPNFPAYRALFHGFLSSLYGVKEALRNACGKISKDSKAWWESKFKEIQQDPLLHLFYKMHNQDKHALEQSILQPRTKLFGYAGAVPERLGAEGVSVSKNAGTKYEQRQFLRGAVAAFECYLLTDNPNDDPPSVKGQLDLVLDHYKTLVWESERQFGERTP